MSQFRRYIAKRAMPDFLYMQQAKWEPSKEEREIMEAVWMQVKGACEKLKEETNAQDKHIRKMLAEMAVRYYS